MTMFIFLLYVAYMIKQHSADLEIQEGNLEVVDYEIFCRFLCE